MAEQRYAAAFAQQRLWLLQELEPEGTAYQLTEAFRVFGPLDIPALSRAADELCARHEALRTRFEQVDGAILQVVADRDSPQARPGFHRTRLEAAVGPDREAVVEAFHRAAMELPFDLRSGPLLRVHVGELGPDQHAVVVTAHHIACDGWSMGLLLAELSSLYRSFLLGEPVALPEPELQYTDYAVWEREWLDQERTGECLRYWRDYLSGAPTVLSLPADRPRRAGGFPESGVHDFLLPELLTHRLQELVRATRSSLSIVLLAAFHAFLGRISGERDLLVGYPVSGRTQAGSESLVGMLVNTLPLRGDLRDDPSFEQLLLRVRESVLDGQEYGELPFERMVEEVNPDRIPGVNPLVQVMFQLLDESFTSSFELEGATTRPVRAAQPTTFFDLSLDVFHQGEELRASFNYSRELFDQQTVARFADCFLVLLEAAVEQPHTSVSALALLSPAEESRILRELGHGPTVEVPADATVLTALDRQIAARPGEIAVADAERQRTYRELGEAVDALAAELGARGIARGDRVGLLVKRSGLLPVGIFGILRAGAVLVPLDAANPAERLRAMTGEAEVRLVVTDAGTRPEAERLGLPLLDLGKLAARPGRRPLPAAAPGPDDPAYIVFTSGSTSTPKGVVVQHGALANLYHSHRNSHYAEMAGAVAGRRLRVVYTMSVAFDASWDQLLWMVDGNLLYVVDDDTARDAQQLLIALREQEIDVLEATPSFLEQLVGLGLLDGDRRGPALFVLGGEAMRPSLWSRLAADPEVLAVNLYGPTEFTVDALGAPVTGDAGPVVGRPSANCRVALLDASGRTVPVGVVGEICLSGPQLALGYLNDPVRTADRFVPDPFAPVPGARMCRTGDLGRLRADGAVEFVGRVDGQVKIRGYRVDPGEVESALLAHPLVQDAAVLALPDPNGHHRLVGYIVAHDAPATDALREHLAARLPEYMVPTAIVRLDQIPRNVSGKVATARLPEPDASARRAADYAAPLDRVEQKLAEIFGTVLGLDRVGRFDDFFRLGGHSLTAVQLISRIRAGLGAEISLRALFEQPTVAGLSAALRGRADEEQPIPVPAPGGPAVASSAQQRLWFLQQIAPGNTGYNMVEALRLRGVVDVPALARAVAVMVARHDVLRSRYELGDNRLLLTVDPSWGQEVTCLDLTSLPADQARQRAAEHVQEVGRRSYDLESGPLFEASVLTLGPEEHLLVFGVHHIVCDGWSVKVLLSEISAHYRDLTAERAPRLPEPRIQYQDFAVWERGADHEARLAEHLAYWRAQLAGAPTEPALSADRQRPEVGSGRGATVRFEVPGTVTAALTDLAHAHRTTLFTALLAAFEAVLARWTGQRDLMVGVPVAGRTRAELEGLIGLFVNILPIRADLGGDPAFEEFLDQVRDTTLSGYAHQALPFERLVELVNPDRNLGLNPLVQATCQLFEDSGAAGLEIDGVSAEPFPFDIPSSRFDISLDLTRQADGLSGELVYDAELFERATAVRLVEAFQAFLREVGQDPSRPVWEIPRGIDCKEVESALLAHPQVQEAAVLAHRGPDGSPRVVAHLVTEDDVSADDFEAFMESWRSVFESTYASDQDGSAGDSPLLGWVDSFTGSAVLPQQMDEWVAATVGRISALKPRRLLEIGAGTGLLLRPLCEQAQPETYVATDYADSAVEILEQSAGSLAGEGSATTVVVRQSEALGALRAVPGEYDTVVLNSVAQYFPSLAYLRRVIDEAVSGLSTGGHLFLGDLRNGALVEAFLSLREQLRHGAGATRAQLVDAVDRALRTDSELSVDPRFFSELLEQHQRITAVEIAPRRGVAANEMSLFRYDVIVHVGCAHETDGTRWETGRPAGLDEIEQRLATGTEPFGYRRVGNARLTESLALRDAYGFTGTDQGSTAEPGGIDPEALWRLGERYGWVTRIGWGHGDAHGTLEVAFLPGDRHTHYTLSAPLTADRRGPAAVCDTPVGRVLAPQLERAITSSLQHELRSSGLAEELIPDQFIYHTGPLARASLSV